MSTALLNEEREMNENAEKAIFILVVLESTLEEFKLLPNLAASVSALKKLVEKNKIEQALSEANELLSLFARSNIVFLAAKIDEVIELLVKIDQKNN